MSLAVPSVLQRTRQRATIIPGLIAGVLFVFWGGDLAIRHGLHWSQVAWLLIVVAALSLLSLPIVVPLTLVLDRLAQAVGATVSGRSAIYAATFAAAGASIGLATSVVSLVAAVLAGTVAGFLIARVCANSNTASK